MKKVVSTFLALIFSTSLLQAQASNYISAVRIGDAKERTPVTVSADLMAAENLSSISIFFKKFGENEYRNLEMMIAGNTAAVSIPAEYIIPPYLDYYLLVYLKDGNAETYPLGIEQGRTPLQIPISGVSEKDKEIIILSPLDGEILSQENMLVSISFFKAPDNIDINKTRIYLNNENVSSRVLIAGDLIILSGENFEGTLSSGSRLLKVEIYDKQGNLYHSISRTFQLVSAEVAAEISSRWRTAGNIRAESRSETYNSASTWYNNVNAEANASTENWRFSANVYFTSEDKNNLQPYNRYSALIQGGDWLELRLGDTYPRFPSLIMDGKRIRGISGFLNLGFLNVAAAIGESDRKIEGALIETFAQGQVPLGSDIISINETKYGDPFGRVSLGTYTRDLFALRPSFGSGENFQLGFTYLHSKDNTGSIEFGARPQENIVVGSDIKFAMDNQNILFTTQVAFSMFNKDIASGNLTDTQIDSIFGPNGLYDIDPDQVKTIRDILGNFITVNQYIGPLNPQEFASVAGEAALSLNYLNNSLRGSYIYRGNDYLSFGQSFIRTDVKGFNIVDRIRMFDNKVFLSFGYESLEDNLQKTKPATTKYNTLSASISIFPRVNFPNITIGYNKSENKNGLSITNPTMKDYVVDDITNRIILQLSYDFVALVKHNTSLSFTTQNREDNSLSNVDAKYNATGLTVNSYWTSQLSSIFQVLFSSSEIKNVPFEYVTLTLGGRYRLLENKLQLSAMLSPSFGDFKRQALELMADYNVLQNFNLAFQARVFSIPGKSTNSIIGLVSRFNF
ncbi:MAG: hypothetical protein RDU14_00385 [Melioribacteraceae bacterium]|nr:hypothetical protein [Melioribacteraceae bacterium]